MFKSLAAVSIAWLTTTCGAYAADIATAIDGYALHAMRQWQTPGMAIAVVHRGRVDYLGGLGVRELGSAEPMDADTVFTVASLTKAFTAMAAAAAVDAGRIRWDEPVIGHLAQFRLRDPYVTAEATFRDLHRDEDLINTVHYTDMTAALTKFQDRPLASAPGTRYLYSSFGYNLLGAVVESVTGQRFTAAMRDCVIVPLGLRDTEPDEYRTIIDNRTAFYVLDASGAPRNAPAVDNSDLWPAGGYLSTAEDLVGFADQVVNGDFLRARTKQLMLTPSKENLAEQRNYALGWSTRSTDGMTVVGHTGSHYGATTRLSVYREARLAVAVLTNVSQEASSNLEKSLLELSDRVAREFIDAASVSQR